MYPNKIDRFELDSLPSLKKEMKKKEMLILSQGKEDCYAVISIDLFEKIYDTYLKYNDYFKPKIDVVSYVDREMSTEEFDEIKKEVLKALEASLKPKKIN